MTATVSKARRLRDLLRDARPLVSPGVYDGYSARLVEAAGFEMAATTGAGISNSLLGIDDIGVMGLSENVTHCRMLARTLSVFSPDRLMGPAEEDGRHRMIR